MDCRSSNEGLSPPGPSRLGRERDSLALRIVVLPVSDRSARPVRFGMLDRSREGGGELTPTADHHGVVTRLHCLLHGSVLLHVEHAVLGGDRPTANECCRRRAEVAADPSGLSRLVVEGEVGTLPLRKQSRFSCHSCVLVSARRTCAMVASWLRHREREKVRQR